MYIHIHIDTERNTELGTPPCPSHSRSLSLSLHIYRSIYLSIYLCLVDRCMQVLLQSSSNHTRGLGSGLLAEGALQTVGKGGAFKGEPGSQDDSRATWDPQQNGCYPLVQRPKRAGNWGHSFVQASL